MFIESFLKLFYFLIQNTMLFYSIDATKSQQLGKFVNDSSAKHQNCTIKPIFDDKNNLHLCLFARRFIPKFTELRYSYDFNSKDLVWRQVIIFL